MRKQKSSVLESAVSLSRIAGLNLRDATRQFRRAFIVSALRESAKGKGRPNLCRAAEGLGMHRNTLSRTLSELGINPWALPLKSKPYTVHVEDSD